MADNSEKSYGGRSLLERAAERRTILIDAGIGLLGTQGAKSLSIRSVLATSGLSQRYFYESFGNLDDFQVAIFDSIVMSVTSEAITDISESNDPYVIVHAVVGAFASAFADRKIRRIALLESWGSEPVMQKRVSALEAGGQLLAAALQSRVANERQQKDLEIASMMIVGGLLHSMIHRVDDDDAFSADGEFVRRFSALAGSLLHDALKA